MNAVYLGLGSNLQNPLAQLRAAVRSLDSLPDTELVAVSGVWRSAAIGPGEQPDYLNAVARLSTGLTPHQLLDRLQDIENSQGRERAVRWGARTLDLDILLYGDMQLHDERLVIPHPRMRQRDFVLQPLFEVATGTLMLPDGAELGTLVAACPPGEVTRTDLLLVP